MTLDRRRRIPGLAAIAAAAILVGGCTGTGTTPAAPSSAAPSSAAPASVAASSEASASAGGSAAGTNVTATESEFKIELGATTAPAGPVNFQITNGGTIQHEFVVVKTDLAADKLPMKTGESEVDEDNAALTAVDEVEDIDPKATPTLTVNLPAGHYVVFCNIEGHYAGGMHVDFTTS
ncbi:MAG TPA: sulfocyanin-like copper-binding protein [Candidatus Limnocylindrales bacterium]|nr:sulfocyanin-like copper-binding protein [Candidatus Limnocylindrales bacterium]